jgi:hypothetical protein
MGIVADSSTPVARNTAQTVNRRIAAQTRQRLTLIGDDQHAIADRLLELEREWDIERALAANAAAAVFIGTALGLTVHRRFLAAPLVVAGFLLLHAVQGWCPPVPVLRRLGFRTCREIEDERNELLKRRSEGD